MKKILLAALICLPLSSAPAAMADQYTLAVGIQTESQPFQRSVSYSSPLLRSLSFQGTDQAGNSYLDTVWGSSSPDTGASGTISVYASVTSFPQPVNSYFANALASAGASFSDLFQVPIGVYGISVGASSTGQSQFSGNSANTNIEGAYTSVGLVDASSGGSTSSSVYCNFDSNSPLQSCISIVVPVTPGDLLALSFSTVGTAIHPFLPGSVVASWTLTDTVYYYDANGNVIAQDGPSINPNGSGTPPVVPPSNPDEPPTTATPEPSSFMLLGSGLVGLGGMIRRKLKA